MIRLKYSPILLAVVFFLPSASIQTVSAQSTSPGERIRSPEEMCAPRSRLFSRHGFKPGKLPPLFEAVTRGDNEVLWKVISEGANVNAADEYGTTPLMTAAGYGDVEAIKLLANAKAEINVLSKFRITPLINATRCSAAVKALIDYGALIDLRTQHNETALMHAARNRNLASVKLLLAANADIYAKNGDDWTPLSFAVAGNDPAIVQHFLNLGAAKELSTALSSATNLSLAASSASPEIVRLLLAAGAKANAVGKYEMTPLTTAAQRGNVDVVRLLIAAGADPNHKVSNTASPLAWASTYGYTEMVKELLAAKARVYNKEDWWPSLVTAARNEHTETMDVLLKAGANINMRAYDGKTALMYAAWEAKPKSVRFLIEKGANVNIRDEDDNVTALSLALNSTLAVRKEEVSEIILLLKKAGAID